MAAQKILSPKNHSQKTWNAKLIANVKSIFLFKQILHNLYAESTLGNKSLPVKSNIEYQGHKK